jgi:hypothetical protein
MAERDLGNKIGRFEILGAKQVAPSEGLRGAVVEVSVTIDGRPLKIRAVRDEQLAWAG